MKTFGFEHIPKNAAALLRARFQQLSELTLGNHGNLRKLIAINADNLSDSLVHLSLPGNGLFSGAVQFLLCSFRSHARSGFLCALVFRISSNPIFFSIARKNQLHLCWRVGSCIHRPKHAYLPVFTAGLAIECVSNGIKNGSLSGSGVSGNQIKPVIAQSVEINLYRSGIGSKAGNL